MHVKEQCTLTDEGGFEGFEGEDEGVASGGLRRLRRVRTKGASKASKGRMKEGGGFEGFEGEDE